jgi:hypothetical protein
MPRNYAREYADLAGAYKSALSGAKSNEGRDAARRDYEEALREIAIAQEEESKSRLGVSAPAQAAAPSRQLSTGQEAKGLARSLAQGASFGFGEEIESLGYALPGGESPAEARQRIRGEMREYREARPGRAFAAETAGAFIPALVTGGAAAPAAAGRTIAQRTAQAVGRGLTATGKSAALSGALSGAGAAEGGLGARTVGATVGTLTGTAIGKAGGAVAASLGRGAERMAWGAAPKARPGEQAVARMAERAGIENVVEDLGRAAKEASPETRVMDVLGGPGRRLATAVRLSGGRPGEVIEQEMAGRIEQAPDRLIRALGRTGRAAENLTETVDNLIAQRKAAADPLYAQLREQPPVMDRKLEEMIATRPSLKRAQRDAVNLAAEEGVQLPTIDTPSGPMPLRTPEMLHYMKLALDDMIDIGKKPGEGGMGRTALGKIQDTKNEFLNIVDSKVPVFKQARDAWAGPSALKTAIADGAEAAKSKVDVNELAKDVSEKSASELEFYRRGYIQVLRQKVDDGQLKPADVRNPGFEKRMRAVFGDESDAIVNTLREEMDLTQTGQRINLGSPTAERLRDVEDLEGGLVSGRAIRTYAGDRLRTVARGAENIEARIRAGRSEGIRGKVGEALMRPVRESYPLMTALAREQAAERAGERARRTVAPSLSRLFGGMTSRGLISGQ